MQITRQKLKQAGEAEPYRAYLEGECLKPLCRYLEKRKATLRAGTRGQGQLFTMPSGWVSVLRTKKYLSWGNNTPVPSYVKFFKKFIT